MRRLPRALPRALSLRKERVSVYLYQDEVEMLDLVCRRTGDTRSELLRRLLRNYLDQLNLMRERVHSDV